MKKTILWGLALLILLPIVVIIAIIGVNLFDEKLDPKAAAWGEPRVTTVPDAENGYYALLALGAPAGTDGAAYARAWVNEARTAARENRDEKQPAVKRTKRPDMCDPANASCLDAARAKNPELLTALDAYKEDLARYGALLSSKRYEEVLDYPMRVASGLPSYIELQHTQRALLTQAAIAAEAGNLEEAITAVERDIAYYRAMLGGARTVIGKMVAARRYWASLAFLTDLLKQKSAAMEPLVPRLRELLTAIDPSSLKLDAAMESEFAAIKQILHKPPLDQDPAKYWPLAFNLSLIGDWEPVGNWLPIGDKPFHKPNATINRGYSAYSGIAVALIQPPGNIKAAMRDATRMVQETTTLSYLNNPVGKMLVDISISSYSDGKYALLLHDLDAFNRLVALRVEALAAKIDAKQAAEFAAKSETRLHDPYTGKPMVWDAVKNRYQFTPRGSAAKQNSFNMDAGGAYVAL